MNWIPRQAEKQTAYARYQLRVLTSHMMEPVHANALTYEAQQYILGWVEVMDTMITDLTALLEEVDSTQDYP